MRILNFLAANWHAPSHIHALTTTRNAGVSQGPFQSNNFGLHVQDRSQDVEQNRRQLLEQFKRPSAPIWLNQTHSNRCVLAETINNYDADAIITRSSKITLAIMTADCLPITLCDQDGHEIAAIHAGWRGLANGIIENTLSQMQSHPSNLLAWIGPAICQNCFTVNDDVKLYFKSKYSYLDSAFKAYENKYLANLPLMAELILNQHGITNVYQSNACTFEQDHEFYSYRRTPQTGRMATLVWIEDTQ